MPTTGKYGSDCSRHPLLQLLAGVLLLGLLVVAAFFLPPKAEGQGSALLSWEEGAGEVETETDFELPCEKTWLWAHSVINIRSGPGLEYRVIGKLSRGERVELDREREGWGRILRDDGSVGHVLLELLRNDPLPLLEIVRWDWKRAPRMGRSGVVVWVVEVRNNSPEAIDHVQVEFVTLNSEGHPLEKDVAYLRKVNSGALSAMRSFVAYTGNEKSAEVRLLDRE